MSLRDRAPVDVQALAIEAEVPLDRDDLRGERLVELDEVDVRERETRRGEDAANRGHRADPHDLRRHANDLPPGDAGGGLDPLALRGVLRENEDRGGAVRDA